MADDSDVYWNNFKAALKLHPPTVDRIAQAIHTARATLPENEQPILDELLNAIYPYTFCAEACHHMFWMNLRGILKPEDDPIATAATDISWPQWQLRELPPPPNLLKDIVAELAALRDELKRLKGTIPKKANLDRQFDLCPRRGG